MCGKQNLRVDEKSCMAIDIDTIAIWLVFRITTNFPAKVAVVVVVCLYLEYLDYS